MIYVVVGLVFLISIIFILCACKVASDNSKKEELEEYLNEVRK